jgi:sugar lactone lactonase YvrE
MRVSDGDVHELDVPGVPLPQGLAWSPDGRSLFIVDLVAKGSTLGWRVLHADLAGHVQVLRHSNLVWQWLSSPLPSPDGRYLAFGQLEFQSNAWSLEGF